MNCFKIDGNVTWKKNSGRILFWALMAVVLFNQLLPQILGAFGINVPWNTPDVYVYASAAIVLIHAVITLGWKRASVGFMVLFLIGFSAESMGVNTGWVYGPYHYADFLPGPRLIGVPISVPFSWELNMYPAFYLALYLFPSDLLRRPNTQKWKKVLYVAIFSLVSAGICTFYDMLCDPVGCLLLKMWVWHIPGDYFPTFWGGIPLANYGGWVLTGIIGSIFLLFLFDTTPAKQRTSSNYLSIGCPLLMYIGSYIYLFAMNQRMIGNEALLIIGLASMGFTILMVLLKKVSEKSELPLSEKFNTAKQE